MAFAFSFLVVTLLPAVALAAEEDLFTRMIKKGPLLGAVGAFGGGLLVSLTPCVYPMIAITVSVFGAREAKSRTQAMLLSTSFVLGIVALFTPMLVIAALTGGLFGSVLSNTWVIVGICVIFAAMAASMFGAFDLTLPESMMQRFSTVGGIGYGGAFLLGLVSGLVAAPCTGPVLTSILVWISQTRSVLLGTIVGACFSIGLGIPFWLVGTFAISLPKGGKWMLGVKSFFGIVMLIVAFYFLKNAFPALKSFVRPDTSFMLIALGVLVAGVALGAIHLAWDDGGIGIKIRKGLGISMAVVGGALFWTSCDMPRGSPRVAALRAGGLDARHEREAPDDRRLHRGVVRRLQRDREGDVLRSSRAAEGSHGEVRRREGRRHQRRGPSSRRGEGQVQGRGAADGGHLRLGGQGAEALQRVRRTGALPRGARGDRVAAPQGLMHRAFALVFASILALLFAPGCNGGEPREPTGTGGRAAAQSSPTTAR